MKKFEFSPAVIELSERIGKFIEYWGFRAIDGRIWLLVYISKVPIDTGTLIHNLKVSKGLVSTAIKELLDYGLIREVDIGDNRSKYYEASMDVMEVITNVLKQREEVMLNEIIESFEKISEDEIEIDKGRLKRIEKMLKFGNILLSGIIKFSKIDLTPWKKKL